MSLPSSVAGLGLAATLDDLEELCRRRLSGDETLGKVDFLNLGLNLTDTVSDGLASLVEATGWTVVIHAADLNLSTAVDRRSLGSLRQAGEALRAAWFEEDLGIWTWDGMSLGLHHVPPTLDAESVARTAENIGRCAKALGRPFIVENPPTYFMEGPLDMWSYLSAVGNAADCGLVLDSGHMIGFHINSDSEVRVAPPHWDGWSRVQEIHVSGFQIVQMRGRRVWIDRHPEPLTAGQLRWVETALARLSRPCAVCLELDGASPATVTASVGAIRRLLDGRGC